MAFSVRCSNRWASLRGSIPIRSLFPLLNTGFISPCYDGQTFFSATHPVQDANSNDAVASNVQAGTGPAWFLLDTTNAFRPMIWQKRIPYEFQALVSPTAAEVFFRDEYLYGVRARVNAGFGLWQLAFGSQAPLTADNYAAARSAMMSLRGDRGGILGVNPNLLVVPPSLESAGAGPAEGDDNRGGRGPRWAL